MKKTCALAVMLLQALGKPDSAHIRRPDLYEHIQEPLPVELIEKAVTPTKAGMKHKLKKF